MMQQCILRRADPAAGLGLPGTEPLGRLRWRDACLVGEHGLSNLLAALTTLAAVGYPLSELAALLARSRPRRGV